MTDRYVELHASSAFSFLQAASQPEDLIERAGEVSVVKLSEIDDALRASEQRAEWTPAAAARLSKIKDSLRPSGPQ